MRRTTGKRAIRRTEILLCFFLAMRKDVESTRAYTMIKYNQSWEPQYSLSVKEKTSKNRKGPWKRGEGVVEKALSNEAAYGEVATQ